MFHVITWCYPMCAFLNICAEFLSTFSLNFLIKSKSTPEYYVKYYEGYAFSCALKILKRCNNFFKNMWCENKDQSSVISFQKRSVTMPNTKHWKKKPNARLLWIASNDKMNFFRRAMLFCFFWCCELENIIRMIFKRLHNSVEQFLGQINHSVLTEIIKKIIFSIKKMCFFC